MNALRSFLDSPWIMAWLSATTKGFILLLIASLACVLLRKRSAAIRHFVWGLALAGAFVLPAISLVVPALSFQVPGGWANIASTPNKTIDKTIARTEPLPTAPKVEALAESRQIENTVVAATPSRARGTQAATTGTPPSLHSSTSPPSSLPHQYGQRPLMVWVMAGWALGVLGALTPALAGAWVLRRVKRRSQPIEDTNWLRLRDELMAQLGLTRPISLLGSSETLMPMTWGWRKPVVLLPQSSSEWTEPRRRAVLLHELAHIQRADCLTQQLAHIACAFHWHNPLAWLAARQMRQERERACDDQVIRRGLLPSEYAAHLVALARSHRSLKGAGLAAVAMARRSPSQLEVRVHALLDPRKGGDELSYRSAGLVFLGLALLLVPLSALRLRADDAPTAEPSKAKESAKAPPVRTPIMITGKVLDSEGKPIQGAKLVALATQPDANGSLDYGQRLVGQAQSHESGQFQLEIPEKPELGYSSLNLMVTAQGHGFINLELPHQKAHHDVTLRLRTEKVVTVRLVDLQGVPASNASLQLSAVSGDQPTPWWLSLPEAPQALPLALSTRITTDSQGRFELRGFGPSDRLTLEVHDDRFASQRLDTETGPANTPKDVTFPLVPAHRLEGKVTFEDTGKPAVGAKLIFQIQTRKYDNMPSWRTLETDAEGRYQFIPGPGKLTTIFVYPPPGSPYLFRRTEQSFTEGKQQTIDLSLRRGIAVKGKVTDATSGLPITGAMIEYRPKHDDNPHFREDAIARFETYEPSTRTGTDGTFVIGVLPGKGNLLVKGHASNYVHIEVTNREIEFGPPGGHRYHPDAHIPLDLKPETTSHDVAIKLKPGKTVEGKAIGPDGQPIVKGLVFARSFIPNSFYYNQNTLPIQDGRFSIPGCDPDQENAVYFIDPEHQLGAMVMISGKQAGTPVTVKLERCGSVSLQYVDKKGKPYSKDRGRLLAFTEVELSAGPDWAMMMSAGDPVRAERMIVANLDRIRYRGLEPDDQGKITYPTLIPSVPLRLVVADDSNWVVKKEFRVQPGETLDLGPITLNDLDKD